MTELSDFGQGLTLKGLVDDSKCVGGIFDMDYERCVIYTNDHLKMECGGLPQHTFLIGRMDYDVSEKERSERLRDHALLLRVSGPADLPAQSELTGARYQNMEERVIGEIQNETESHSIDAITRQEIQKSAVEAEVVGTFYLNDDGELEFGEGAHTVFQAGDYLVYKPEGETLSEIASYIPPGKRSQDSSEMVNIGHVKYASAKLNQTRSQRENPEVEININDFVGGEKGNKTAVFGMTRTGKSNTMKVLAAAIHTKKDNVGQLIFDPVGEYAEENEQDPVPLAAIDDDTEVFAYGVGQDDDRDANPIGYNLLNPEYAHIAVSRAKREIKRQRNSGTLTGYAKGLKQEFPNPDKREYTGDDDGKPGYGQETKDRRKLAALHAVLIKAGVEPNEEDDLLNFDTNKEIRSFVKDSSEQFRLEERPKKNYDLDIIDEERGDIAGGVNKSQKGGGNTWFYNAESFADFWEEIAECIDSEDSSIDLEEETADVLELLSTEYRGYDYLTELQLFHNPNAEENWREAVYESLGEGNLVVLDLSNGREDVIGELSREVVEEVLNESGRRFKQNDENDLPRIQIFLEEAHRYFSTDKFDEDEDSPYVRLAKEGAKFKIGMVYATQEVTSVDQRILSNTANWIVTHLNNDDEIRQLSKYYDFDSFERVIRDVSEVGFARTRTLSNPYTIPTKIQEFSEEWLNNIQSD